MKLANDTKNFVDIRRRINVNGCFDEIVPIIQQLLSSGALFLLLISGIVVFTIFLTCILSFEIRLTVVEVRNNSKEKKKRENADF